MVKLENLTWDPSWVSHLGCVKGCLNYLGLEMSKGWLYGGTGHAFVINMHQEVCPSGPTAWVTKRVMELGSNLGYRVDGVSGSKREQDLADLQQRAWAFTRQAIDQGLPCYGWELAIPEFYVVYGYDDAGYYYAGPGCKEGQGPKAWGELGDTGIGWIEQYSVSRGEAAGDATVVRQALAFALAHAQNPGDMILPGYKAGLAGFDAWIASVKAGSASHMGLSYNAAVWEECRRFGVEFLKEARGRLDGELAPLFDEALGHYRIVAGQLKAVCELYPFQGSVEGSIPIDDRSRAAVEALKTARGAEAGGLAALEQIVAAL